MLGLYKKRDFCTGPNHSKKTKLSFIDFLDDQLVYYIVNVLYLTVYRL